MITKFRVRITCKDCNKLVEEFIIAEVDVQKQHRFDWFGPLWYGGRNFDIYQYHDEDRNATVRFDRLEDE